MQASPAGLRIALMIVVVDEGVNLGFEVSWQEVVFQRDAGLQGLMPAFQRPAGHCAAMSREVILPWVWG